MTYPGLPDFLSLGVGSVWQQSRNLASRTVPYLSSILRAFPYVFKILSEFFLIRRQPLRPTGIHRFLRLLFPPVLTAFLFGSQHLGAPRGPAIGWAAKSRVLLAVRRDITKRGKFLPTLLFSKDFQIFPGFQAFA